MDAIRPPAVHRTRQGLALFLSLIVLIAASKAILYDTLDPDCFWHLRVAQQLRHDGIGPLVDQLSFSSSHEPWTPYSWLGELGMDALWTAGSYRAAIAAQSVLVAAMFSFIAMACVSACRDRTAALNVLLAMIGAVFFALPYLSFRPATAGLALLALAAWLVARDRELGENSRATWLLVPLTLLYTNVHLFAALVPAMLGAMLLGSVAEWLTAPQWEESAERGRRMRRLAVLFGLCAAACLCTPMLPGLVRSIVHFQNGDIMVAAPVIAELRPFFRGPMPWIPGALILGCYALAWRGRRDIRLGDWLCLVGATALLLRMGRFAPVFAIAAAPIAARCMRFGNPKRLDRPALRFVAAALLLGIFLRIVVAFPPGSESLDAWLNRNGPDTPGYPCAAAAFVERNVEPQYGRVINDFNWGGYLDWRLGSRYQTFMDGRTQLYPASFWRATCLGTEADARRYMASVAADAAILPKGKGNVRAALLDLGWVEAYRDDRAEVLVPPGRQARIVTLGTD